MYRPRRLSRLLAPALVLLALAQAGAQEQVPVAPERAGLSATHLKRLDALLRDAVERKQVAGAVGLLARHGKIGYFAAVGARDAEADKPMTRDTIFRIASMTKPVTSVAVLILADDGRLRVTDPLSKFVPEFKDPKVLVPAKDGAGFTIVPAEREITLHDLLTHTSGIVYRLFNAPHLGDLYEKAGVSDGLVQTEGSVADNVRRIASLPLLHHPGRAWTYGLSTDVLGRVVEVASGKPLDVFFRERIFEPLGMKDTHFYLPIDKRNRLSALYRPGPDGAVVRVGEEPVRLGALTYSGSFQYKGPRTYFSGGAGLVSTAADYFRFLQMLLNGGELDGVRVLKPETVKAMTANQVGEFRLGGGGHGDQFGYGFGVLTANGKDKDPASVGTYSWGGIFNTYFWVDPRKELVGILLTQVYPNDGLPLRADFKRLAYEALAEGEK